MEMCKQVEHLKGVDRAIQEAPTWHIVDVMRKYLNSSSFNIDERRRVRKMLTDGPKLIHYDGKPFAPAYHGLEISSYRLEQLRHGGWALYIAVMIEFALEDKKQVLNDIIPKLDMFMESTGHPEMAGRLNSPKSKGLLTAALILGGITYRNARKLDGQVSRVLCPSSGTELLTLQERIDMAMKRCKSLGIEERDAHYVPTDAHTRPETISELI